MVNKKKLKATHVYINHDLTQEQLQRDRELRKIRARMLKDADYKGKKITIYKGNLYVDRIVVETSTLHHFSDKD